MLSRQIERAQRKVEAHNFDVRKNLLEYDDVANDQRKVIYQQRTELMDAEDVADAVRRHPRRGREHDHRRASCRRRAPRRCGTWTGLARRSSATSRVRIDAARAGSRPTTSMDEDGLRQKLVEEVEPRLRGQECRVRRAS